jgi:hypothetical protein
MRPITLHVESGVKADGTVRHLATRFNPDHLGTNVATVDGSYTVQESPEEIDAKLYELVDRDASGMPVVAVKEASGWLP